MAQAQARYEDASIMSVDPNMLQTQQKLKGLGTTRPSFNTPFKINLGGVQGALTTENPIATIEPGKAPQINRQLVAPQEEVSIEEQTSTPSIQSTYDLIADISENGDISEEDIQQFYPEFVGKEKAIADLAADISENGDITEEELQQYYPELVGGEQPSAEGKGGIGDFLAGMGQESVSQILPKTIAGGLDLIGADKARDFVLRYAKFADEEDKKSLKRLGIDPETGAFKAGAKTSDIGVTTAGSLLLPAGKALKALDTIKNPLLRVGLKSALGGATGVGEVNLYTAATEGRKATKEENTFAGILGGGLPVVGAAAGAIKEGVQSIAPKLQLSGLLNPAKLTSLKQQLIDEGTKATGTLEASDVGKWMIARGFKGDKEQIVQNLVDYSTESKGLVDNLLSSSKTLHKSEPAKRALQNLYDDVSRTPGLEEEATQLQGLLSKDQYQLSELNQIKRQLDDAYNLYTQAGGETSGLKAKGLRNLRADLRKQIEDVATEEGLGDIKMLNNETSISRGLADAISKKDSADQAREVISLFTKGAAGGTLGLATGPFDGNTVEGKIGNFVVGAILGEFAGSTRAKTTIASWLRGLSGIEKKSLQRLIDSKGKEAISESLAKKAAQLKNVLDISSKDANTIPTNTPNPMTDGGSAIR